MVQLRLDGDGVVAGEGPEVEVQPLHHGAGVVLEVDCHHAAHRGGHLVQQAAGLAEKDVLRILPGLGNAGGGALAIKEQLVEDVAQQHLESGAGAEAAALEDGGGGVGVEALQLTALALEPGGYAADEGGGGVALLLPDLQAVQLHNVHGEALALDADDVLPVGSHGGNDIQVDTAGQHQAVLVVGVVAADLRAARRGEDGSLVTGAKGFGQARQKAAIAVDLAWQLLGGVEPGECLLQLLKISLRGKLISHSAS